MEETQGLVILGLDTITGNRVGHKGISHAHPRERPHHRCFPRLSLIYKVVVVVTRDRGYIHSRPLDLEGLTKGASALKEGDLTREENGVLMVATRGESPRNQVRIYIHIHVQCTCTIKH